MKTLLVIILMSVSQLTLGYVEFPKSCLSAPDSAAQSVCHFGTVKNTSQYEDGHIHIYLGVETLLKKEKDVIEWVYGTVLFEVSSKSEVFFKNNKIILQKGTYIFFGSENALKVEVLDGNLKLGKYQVTEGFQATFGTTLEKKITLEPLQAIDLKEHLVRYVKLKNLGKEKAKEYLDEFSPKHANYLAWAAELNQNLIKRSIAHDQRVLELERDAKERARVAQEKRKIDFFNKVFER